MSLENLEKKIKRLELIVKEMQNYLANKEAVDFEPFDDEYSSVDEKRREKE